MEAAKREYFRPRKPAFLREIEIRSHEVGMLAATAEILERDRVILRTRGDVERLQQHSGGILMVGDHKHQWEFLAAMCLAHQLGRSEMLHVVKFYVHRQIRQTLGAVAASQLLPVYPRILASDRPEFWNSETFNRLAYRRHLLDTASSATANEAAVQKAAAYLGHGGIVDIFPCGGIADATHAPWRTGVGRIMSAIPAEQQKNTLVAPYRVDDIQRGRLVAAVALRGRGPLAPPQTMTLELGSIRPITSYGEETAAPASPLALTTALREQFLADFQVST